MSEKSYVFSYGASLYKYGQDLLEIQYLVRYLATLTVARTHRGLNRPLPDVVLSLDTFSFFYQNDLANRKRAL